MAKAVSELLAMASGTRPLRTVVGLDFGVAAINAAVAPKQQAMLEGLGLADLFGLASLR